MPLLLAALLDDEWQDTNFSGLGFTSFNIIISPPPLFLKNQKQKNNPQTLLKNPPKPNPN